MGILGCALVLLLLLVQGACAQHASITSPDGKYVAVVTYALQGALGDDYADVNIRRWWNPHAENVYSGLGSWDFKNAEPFDPEVRWLDGSRLLITYRDDRTGKEGRGGPAVCRTRIGAVEIVCASAGTK